MTSELLKSIVQSVVKILGPKLGIILNQLFITFL
jgi:hypothetical protein